MRSLINGLHRGLKAKTPRERAIDMEMPGICKRLGGWWHRFADELNKLKDRGRRLINNIDNPTVQGAGQGEVHRRGNVTMVDQAHPLSGMPLGTRRMLRQGFQVAIPVAIDEAEALDRPVQIAVTQLVLGRVLRRRPRSRCCSRRG